MPSPFSSRTALAGLVLLSVVGPLRADKLTKAEIGKLGKAATAFVEVPDAGSGTAFCVHPSGLFITNEHVIRGAEKGRVTLIMDAGQKSQKVLPATVVRADRDEDLALLRADTKGDLPTLALGSADGLTELADVVAFGFPLGAALSTDRKEYPAISVSPGTVAALRRQRGELQFVQLDISVTFGNSGGPVLDENGKVIGVVTAGVAGERGINLAIPVTQVQKFVSAPDIQLTPTELTQRALSESVEFKAKAVSIVPGSRDPSLRLSLQSDEERPREFPMTKRDGVYVAAAIPVPAKAVGKVRIAIQLGDDTVTGSTDDLELKVAGKAVKLSEARRAEFKPRARVLLADGTIVDGAPEGLNTVDVSLGEHRVKVDLRDAARFTVLPPAAVHSVRAAVIATVDGRDARRIESTLWTDGGTGDSAIPGWQAAATSELDRAKFAYARYVTQLIVRMRVTLDVAIRGGDVTDSKDLEALKKEKAAFEGAFRIPTSRLMREAAAEYRRELAAATTQMKAAYDRAIKQAGDHGDDAVVAALRLEKSSLNAVLDDKRTGPPFGRGLSSAVNSAKQLAAYLKDTDWDWAAGLTVRPDGWAVNPDFPVGQTTRWEAVDRRTAVLILDAGRESDRYAVLTFSEDLMSFTGLDFLKATRFDPPVFRKR